MVNGDPKPKYKLASSLQKISKDVFMMDMFVYFRLLLSFLAMILASSAIKWSSCIQ